MDILRRLLGLPTQQTSPVKVSEPRPLADIAAPGTPINIAAPAPVIQPAPKRAEDEVRIDDNALNDLTPLVMPGATRQLPPLETYMSKPGKHLLIGMNSDIGMVRNNNQDSVYTLFSTNTSVDELPDFGLFVVADGMGGHQEGEKASAITTRTIAQYISSNFYMKLLNVKSDEERPIVSEVLQDAVQKANEAVAEQIPEGGTTVTAATIVGDLLYVAHVGDSRAYLIVNGEVEQITRDHSLVQRLIELDQLTPDEASAHPQRNVLYRALGQSDHLDVDAITRRVPAGARLLLCSDGLWNLIPEAVLLNYVISSKTPQEACDRLVATANERGGQDNISVIIVQVPG